MLLKRRPRWHIPAREETPEPAWRGRRAFVGGLLAAGLAPSSAAPLPSPSPSRAGGVTPSSPAPSPRPAAVGPGAYPAPRNPAFTLDRPLTDERVAASHNIFDEFASTKQGVAEAARRLRTRPWTVHIGGLVPQPLTLDVDDLVRRFGLEERLYRHRCVETWAMAVPWTGFPLRKLVEMAQPVAKARFLRMVSFARPEEAPGWYASRRVFPYYEGLTLAEATHDLALLATGIYGHPLPPQHGAPLRLVVPWKYGFKSIKSVVAFQFTEERPGTFWNELSPSRYSFEANVDPSVPVPWPQDSEVMIGTEERRKTQLYNGYADLVAGLYR